jgi:hypothetical protein
MNTVYKNFLNHGNKEHMKEENEKSEQKIVIKH